MKKNFLALFFLFICPVSIFADSFYGFASIAPSFWKWVIAILITIASIAVPEITLILLSDEENLNMPPNSNKAYFFILFFPIFSFFIFPTIFCGFLGLLLSLFISAFFVCNYKHNKINWLYFSLSIICLFAIRPLFPGNLRIVKYFFLVLIIGSEAIGIGLFLEIQKKILAYVFISINCLLCMFFIINSILQNKIASNTIFFTIFFLTFIFILVISLVGFKSLQKQKDEKFLKVFKKTPEELKTIINSVSYITSSRILKDDLQKMVKYLKKAIQEFERGDPVKPIDALEYFFEMKDNIHYKEIKGGNNQKKYKDFCNIALNLSKELNYTYTSPEKYVETYDDETENDSIFITESHVDKDLTLSELLKELDLLIGLSKVKEEINSQIGLLKVNIQRKQLGLKETQVSHHLVFSGNPGTGKTTVARLLAKIYKELGILTQGQYIETDYAGLVSQYISETAQKTSEVVKKAIGGLLFIDEAYTLSSSDSSFGQESIDTLLKYMEDRRDDLVVVAAGYPKEMEKFVNSNPGLKSRFTTFIHFDDYTGEELYDIFLKMCIMNDKIVPENLKKQVKDFFAQLYQNRGKNFANGREVRNYLETCEKRMALRLSKENKKLSKEELSTFTKEDLGL